ncbi:uncharacterized protein SAPINGB_P001455 [Magnusiomyces paraingens]|uniref:Transmembrane protein n=1 Tax=Magnusiomyces paraingens TaxID=2606893 RepID=A0A5E8B609_9ASCO|nr:uncharacterized protein SAPINGB_P001455 [Saprochaete ingens]VVT46924.1 unnamed protein product [Saprochaete ingens]
MSWTREDAFPENTSLIDRSSRVDNDPYNAYLSRHSSNRGGVIFMTVLASCFSVYFIYSFFNQFFCVGDSFPGNEDNTCGEDVGTLLIFLGFTSIMLWVVSITSYNQYRNTSGAINFEETSTGAGFVAWQEENDLPGNYSNWGELIFTGILTIVGFSLAVMFGLRWVHFVPSLEDPDASTPMYMAIFFSIVFLISFHAFIRAVRRHLLFRRYSNAPLLSGVFSEDPDRVVAP